MPTLDDLRKTLKTDGLTPDSASALADAALEMFENDPSLANFTAYSLFRILSNTWDDPQAVPTADIANYQASLQPRLLDWMRTASAFNDPNELSATLRMLRTCQKQP